MKKFLQYVLPIFLFLLLPNTVSAQPTEETILRFDSKIKQEQNTDIQILEEIHYYFPSEKHGIIREIPVEYKVLSMFKRPTRLILNSITYYDIDTPEIRYSEYQRESTNGYEVFKIGSGSSYVSGEYVFVLDYTLKDAVNFFDDHDELFLNITGNGWAVPILEATAELTVPGEITDKICFTGATGSTISDCSFTEKSPNSVILETNTVLPPFSGYTVAIAMPKGTLEDTRSRQLVALILGNVGVLLPLPTLILGVSILKRKGKNEKLTVIPNYEAPQELTPLSAGFIYSNNVINKHITAEIIKLAVDGHIKIRQDEKNKYTLVKENSGTETSTEASKILLEGILAGKEEVNLKNISTDFYKTVSSLRVLMTKEAYDKDFFDNKKRKLKGTFVGLGILALVVGFFSSAPLAFMAAGGWTFGIIFSGIISIILGLKVDLKSLNGNKIYHELLGLKLYIETAEKHRIEFHNDPKKYLGVFENLLPYAIIFGLEKKWAGEFQDLYQEAPTWYEGNINTFNTLLLTDSISKINSNVQQRSVAPNSSGGFTSSHGGSGGSGFSGGSSGGGFGGGGGSSW